MYTLGRRLFLSSKPRVATCVYTLHERARHYATEPPLFTRHDFSVSNGPPLSMFTPNHGEPDPPKKISDVEWEIRTGRAIYILERTLPDFFHVGLVSNIDPTRPDIVDVPVTDSGRVESIYSPTIRLTYTPPVALPPPFPRTLSLEGLALYMTSSVVIRHTMKTLYSDLRVEMRKMAVHAPSPREKSVLVAVTVHGTTRVSGSLGEWQINSTYGFSPGSGLIDVHTIDSIQPAPHQAAYDALSQLFRNAVGGDMRPGEIR